MPPKIQYSKADLLHAAFSITRTRGLGALNARALARELGCSTQPIFRAFRSMEDIRREVLRMTSDTYARYIARSGELSPKPYLGSGIAYLLFAREEPELFKLLFMCDRVSSGASREEDRTLDFVIGLVMDSTGLTREKALRFHWHLWIYAHGLATMIATHYLVLDPAEAECLLADEYQAVRLLFGLARTSEPKVPPNREPPEGEK